MKNEQTSSCNKVLLLGGGGFIGQGIARYLLQQGEPGTDGCADVDLHLCDNLFRTGGERDPDLTALLDDSRVTLHEADLTDPEAYLALDKYYDQVYVLASVVGVDYVNSVPHEIVRINTSIIMNTLEWLRKIEPKKVLFTSTSECYAGTVEQFGFAVPTDETVPLTIADIAHPRFTYAVTKMLGESGFLNYARAGFFESVVVRYHNVYGPRMGFKHVIPHVVQRLLDGENPFKIYGHDQTRSFNYIDDAVAGTVLAMERGESGEIFHIGDSEEITIETLIHHIADTLKKTPTFVAAETFAGSVTRRCPDIGKSTLHLGYQPQTNWRAGVAETVLWYQDYIKSGSEQYESYLDKKGSLG